MSPHAGRTPGPDHPIAIAPAGGRVVVRFGDEVIVDTRDGLLLRESAYPGVFYLPRADARMERLRRSDRHTYCPYKGQASYFSLPGDSEAATDAIWTYEDPYDAVAPIKDHLAFYADRVHIEHTPD